MSQVTTKDLWTAIWLSENSTAQKTSDFLRSLLPSSSLRSTKGRVKLAIVVGHNKKRPGAYAPYPVNKSEFEFNSEVARLMVQLADLDEEIEVKVFYRKPFSSYSVEIDEVYRRVNAWEPDVAFELHFNWLNQAGRVEMIHYTGSSQSEALAKITLHEFADQMGVIDGAKLKVIPRRKHDLGGRSLWACRCPVVLTEPFDCSNRKHLVRVSELGADVFALTYLQSAKSFARKHLTLGS